MFEVAVRFFIRGYEFDVTCGQWGAGLKWWAKCHFSECSGDGIETSGHDTRGQALDALIEDVEAYMNGETL